MDAAVAAVLADVRTGATQLREYTRRFDGADLERFEVTAEELRAAWDRVDENFRETLRQAADNIRHFHEAQVHRDFCLTDRPGVVLGHEFVGVVEAVGNGISNLRPGDRVAACCESFCGDCWFCRRGYVNNCIHGGWELGCRIDGCQAEYVRVLRRYRPHPHPRTPQR
mgnify:CR=1 FL=1